MNMANQRNVFPNNPGVNSCQAQAAVNCQTVGNSSTGKSQQNPMPVSALDEIRTRLAQCICRAEVANLDLTAFGARLSGNYPEPRSDKEGEVPSPSGAFPAIAAQLNVLEFLLENVASKTGCLNTVG